jgi:hypothetical protein
MAKNHVHPSLVEEAQCQVEGHIHQCHMVFHQGVDAAENPILDLQGKLKVNQDRYITGITVMTQTWWAGMQAAIGIDIRGTSTLCRALA